jgi:desulfoferrodoxin-like iron-binding protein
VLTGGGGVFRSGRVKEVTKTPVNKVGEKSRCNIRHNEVMVTKAGGGTLICCGANMVKVQEKAAVIE